MNLAASGSDVDRKLFFESLRQRLEDRAHGYNTLFLACQESFMLFEQKYPYLPTITDQSGLYSLPIDYMAMCLLPKQWKHVKPLECTGDGNCLYRAASILCCGDQSLHTELRVRTICEIVLNEQFYLQPHIVSLLDIHGVVVSKNVLPATASCCNRVQPQIDKDFALSVLQAECLESTRNGTYSTMWHVHGLASVMKKCVVSIYPDVNQRYRAAFHRECFPRNSQNTKGDKVLIMWTSTNRSLACTNWSPNHFVPCVDTSANLDHSRATVSFPLPPPSQKPLPPVSPKSSAASQQAPISYNMCIKQSLPPASQKQLFSPPLLVSSSPAELLPASFPSPESPVSFPPPEPRVAPEAPPVPSPSSEFFLPPKSPVSFPPPESPPASSPSPETPVSFLLPEPRVASPPPESPPASSPSPETPVSFTPPVPRVASPPPESPPASSPSPETPVSPEPRVASPPPESPPASPPPEKPVSFPPPEPRVDLASPPPESPQASSPPPETPVSFPLPESPDPFPPPESPVSSPPLPSQKPSTPLGFQVPSPPPMPLAHKPPVVTLPQQLLCSFPPPPTLQTPLSSPSLQLPSSSHAQPTFHGTNAASVKGVFASPDVSVVHILDVIVGQRKYGQGKKTRRQSTCLETFLKESGPTNTTHRTKNACESKSVHLKAIHANPIASLSENSEVVAVPACPAGQRTAVTIDTIFKSGITYHGISYASHKNNVVHNHTTLPQVVSKCVNPGLSQPSITSDMPLQGSASEYDSDSDSSYSSFSYCPSPDQDEHMQLESEHVELVSSCTELPLVLPFPDIAIDWYKHQYSLATKNASRQKYRQECLSRCNDKGEIVYMNRSRVTGTIRENITVLKSHISTHNEALIAVGDYILSTGPVVKTRDAGHIYMKKKSILVRRSAVELYEVFSKHLNVSQLYIYGIAFIVYNYPDANMDSIVESLKSTINVEHVVKESIQRKLSDKLVPALKYMDTPRDKQVIKAIIAHLTNVSFTSRLLNLKSRRGTDRAKKMLPPSLEHYRKIRRTSQVVRNDLTVLQQYRLTERVISQRKLKEIRIIAEGRGRKLKSSHYPELSTVLEFAFGELDVIDGGGGLEAHPRLTIGTQYRASDSATTMRRAREVLLSHAPKKFTISLSSCFNYTENYRKGSAQAKRHHAGRGINAHLSLKQPPRTGVKQLVVNLHWSTANVNLIVDGSHNLPHSLIVSKDAKAIIPADIAPVQRPGHSWSRRTELPDHTWDQSRTNAVTPMTFLFLQTVVTQCVNSVDIPASSTTTLRLTRTGQAVTLLNLSFYEPDTTFKCLNELLYMLTLPTLDDFFRDKNTGQLKKEWIFVVDNGPAEQPRSPLVQMCLMRLINFLNLHRITQVSFAEYHSKRNYVERVHAEENRVLSKHGPFSSTSVYPLALTGTEEHKQNIEVMADDVRRCLLCGSFGSKPLFAYRGVKPSDFVFTDEHELCAFLDMNEQDKHTFSQQKYTASRGDILLWLETQWEVKGDYEGDYLKEYLAIQNELQDNVKTSWIDKYTASFYSPNKDVQCRRFELQPIPDYLRWLKTGELHYLPLEERAIHTGSWDDIPGAYLPSKVLDLCFSVILQPTEEIVRQLALLSWITPQEVRKYYDKIYSDIHRQIESEKERTRWKDHTLYKTKNKMQLEKMCRNLKIPVTPSLNKHELTRLICANDSTVTGTAKVLQPLYSGRLSSIPSSPAGVQRLTMPKLRSILQYHNHPPFGGKDQLVLKVLLLRGGNTAAISATEEKQLRDLIKLSHQSIYKQRYLNTTSHVYRKRKYPRTSSSPHFVPPPPRIKSDSDLQTMFQPLLDLLDQLKQQQAHHDRSTPLLLKTDNVSQSDDDLMEKISQTGSKVKIKWTVEEIGDTGWRPGWYTATVQKYCYETQTVTVTYVTEPTETYDEELLPLISTGRIKLIWSPL